MRHRLAVSVLAVGVIFSSVPLYRAVRQEFIPTGVDEAEFEMTVTAPEGISMAAMDDIIQHDGEEWRILSRGARRD